MLVQWRYKIQKCFAIQDGEILKGDYLLSYRGGKAKPEGMYIHKPTRRKWDFVDYTGRFKGQDLDFEELTCILEMLGFIKFVESSNGQEELRR